MAYLSVCIKITVFFTSYSGLQRYLHLKTEDRPMFVKFRSFFTLFRQRMRIGGKRDILERKERVG
jgi:hypothetical protein